MERLCDIGRRKLNDDVLALTEFFGAICIACRADLGNKLFSKHFAVELEIEIRADCGCLELFFCSICYRLIGCELGRDERRSLTKSFSERKAREREISHIKPGRDLDKLENLVFLKSGNSRDIAGDQFLVVHKPTPILILFI